MPQFSHSEGALAFVGTVDREEVPIAAIIPEDQSLEAKRFVEHVAAVTGLEVEVLRHAN